ncbi:CLUMA_CG020618, isoform A [Clunio marinus]|uniref:CLUMA_CG020618, isoform A n=1 Tax=Clunio marinus TaxID=568069 RepID=A0A1J1J5H2_9DIPT|nr:CLUMA_CG020618, isoform A [Clunio marinus]
MNLYNGLRNLFKNQLKSFSCKLIKCHVSNSKLAATLNLPLRMASGVKKCYSNRAGKIALKHNLFWFRNEVKELNSTVLFGREKKEKLQIYGNNCSISYGKLIPKKKDKINPMIYCKKDIKSPSDFCEKRRMRVFINIKRVKSKK